MQALCFYSVCFPVGAGLSVGRGAFQAPTWRSGGTPGARWGPNPTPCSHFGVVSTKFNTGARTSYSAEVGNFTEGGLITTSSCPFKRNEHSQPRPLAPPKSPRGACPQGCGATCVALQGARNGAPNGARKLPGLCPKLARRVAEVGPKLAQSWPKVDPKLARSWPKVCPTSTTCTSMSAHPRC